MQTNRPDIIDDLSHKVVHELLRIDQALHTFMRLARDCPYAGCHGAPCKAVREVLSDAERKAMEAGSERSPDDPVR